METRKINRLAEREYTIGEAADVLGVSIPTIRMYEREGLIIPHRKDSRHRRFSDIDVERIRCIRKMINEEKVSIAGIRMMLALIPCWKIKNCPDEARVACSAFLQTSGACWMASQKAWQCRSAECRACEVYTQVANCATLKQTIAAFTLKNSEQACSLATLPTRGQCTEPTASAIS